MKTAHEVLVAARNSIEHEGLNLMVYGCNESEPCGTSRCVLGWCGWHAGIRGLGSLELFPDRTEEKLPVAYVEALEALRRTAPVEPAFSTGLAAEIENIAFHVDRPRDDAILAWFDDAIKLTAPTPDLSFLEVQEAANA